MSPLSPQSFIT